MTVTAIQLEREISNRQLTNKSQIPLTTDILFGDAVAETAFKTCEGSWEIAVVASMRNMKAI
ncbi:predicted protein [Botrytis cinerea T4]|uniref:Uncharacterized protein n=1 Tax=Botryotinia fuckeliana (strain T4) TaxID=999810 RepID=G2XW46_BOTF4|nr:predicted protein [Botrytis cinerea T4]